MTLRGHRSARRLLTALLLAGCLPCASVFAQGDGSAQQAVGSWDYSLRWRLRAEQLSDSFRLVAPQHDQLFFSRLELNTRYRGERWQFDGELQDSRAWGSEPLSPLGTDDVNTLEPLQLKLTRSWQSDDAELALSFGRMTLNFQSRRLLARNQFRNTSNAFQGALLRHEQSSQDASTTTQLFYTYPLQREPDGLQRDALRDNDFQWDKAGSAERFWGLTREWRQDRSQFGAAAYLFGSRLRDQPSRPVADRDLLTLGGRLTRQRGPVDIEAEAGLQWGESRAGALSTNYLDHRAWFTHLHIGVDVLPDLNLRLAYDQASGDRDPLDNRNERFDRLYGARAFELGPSGIFGAAVRSNLRSPALRALWRASASQSVLLSYRWLELDSATDSFVTGGRRDPSGESGRDLGGQWELSWRLRPANRPFQLQVGGAYLDKGGYFDGSNQDAVLNPAATGDSRYLFAQLIFSY